MSKKMVVDVDLIADLHTVSRVLAEMLSEKKLTEKDCERIDYVNKVLQNCNKLIKEAENLGL